MATYLVDTSVLIDVLNAKRGRDALLRRLLVDGHWLACCGINVTETFAGMRPHEQARTEELLRSLTKQQRLTEELRLSEHYLSEGQRLAHMGS